MWKNERDMARPILKFESSLIVDLQNLKNKPPTEPKIDEERDFTITNEELLLQKVRDLKILREPFFESFFDGLLPHLEERFVKLPYVLKMVPELECRYINKMSKLFKDYRPTFPPDFSDTLKKLEEEFHTFGVHIGPIKAAVKYMNGAKEADKQEKRESVEKEHDNIENQSKILVGLLTEFEKQCKNAQYKYLTIILKMVGIINESIQIQDGKQWGDKYYKTSHNNLNEILTDKLPFSKSSKKIREKKSELLTILSNQQTILDRIHAVEQLLKEKRETYKERRASTQTLAMDANKLMNVEFFDKIDFFIDLTFDYLTNVGLSFAFVKTNQFLLQLNTDLKSLKSDSDQIQCLTGLLHSRIGSEEDQTNRLLAIFDSVELLAKNLNYHGQMVMHGNCEDVKAEMMNFKSAFEDITKKLEQLSTETKEIAEEQERMEDSRKRRGSPPI